MLGVGGEGEQLHTGEQFVGQDYDGAPDELTGSSGARVALVAFLGVRTRSSHPGARTVADFKVGELGAAATPGNGVGGEGGDPVAVGVGDAQLRRGVRVFLAGDDPHPCRPPAQVQDPGQLHHPGPVADVAVGVVGR